MNKEDVSFSIIIPIFNAEKTLEKCLSSILHQTITEYEVLLIDDGSTDDSKSLCEKYLEDNRYKYYYQRNAGPSAARNKGLDNAKGKYIAFIDSDDYVSEDYLEKLLNEFEKKNADVIFMAYTLIGQKKECIQLPLLEGDYYNDLMALSAADMFGYTWIKVFRRRVIENIRFDNSFKIMEDEMFTCEVLKTECSIAVIDTPIYYYYRSNDSLAKKTHTNYCEACEKVYQLWALLLYNYNDKNKTLFLCEKANHFTNNCKYYGLEKDVNAIGFYKKLSECDFFKDSTIEDELISTIKKRNWTGVFFICIKYRAKNKILKLINR